MNKLITAAVATALGLGALAIEAAEQPSAPTTVVMVHGAFADGSSWNKVIPLLQARGLRTVAVQNPLTSLEADVQAAQRAIDAAEGPVVLVGHSWAGTVITQAGGDDKVKSLVYIASFAPALGENSSAATKAYPAPPGVAHFVVSADGYLSLPADAIARDFAQDVSREEAALIAATQGPVSAAAFDQKVTVAAWQQKPSWYIVAAEDRMIHPDAQRALARRMGASTSVLPTSHVPMLSSPQAVADIIIEAARVAVR